MRPVIVAVAGLLVSVSSQPGRAQTAGGPVPLVQSPSPGAAAGGGARRIVGDEGILCARAFEAPKGDLPSVIKACSKIQAKQPTPVDRARVLRYRGIAELRNGEFAAAVDHLDVVIQLTPDDWRALKGRAEAHAALGHRQEAIADYQRLAAMRPGDTVWRVKIAELGGVSAPPALASQEPPAAKEPEPAKSQPAVAAAPPAAPAAEDPAALVRKLQAALRELGYDVGAVNGRLGEKTREALDAFAADIGLPQGGEPGQQYLAAAEEELALRRATAAAAQQDLNRRVQQALAELGYYDGDIDGAFGPMSRRALEGWLAASGRQSGVEVDQALAQSLDAAVLAQVMLARPPATAAAVPPSKFEQAEPKAAEPPLVALVTPTEPPPPAPPPLQVEPPQLAAPPSAAAPPVAKSVGPYEVVMPKAEMPEKRLALVIGNGKYSSATHLVNPKNDADDVSTALSELGFEVLKGVDLTRAGMSRISKDFARRARTVDIAMVYYSGHGVQFDGINYLLPVDGEIVDEFDLGEMVQLNQMIRYAGQAKNLSMVVIDACRDDPLATKSLAQNLGGARSASILQGLAAPQLSGSQIIAYATAVGAVAYDGGDNARNSPYTAALLKHIKTPKLEVRNLFGKVGDEVSVATGNAQRPDKWDNLGGEQIYLVPGPPDPVGLEMADLTTGEVLVVQRSLKTLKYWSGPEDGIATPELTLAVRGWQRQQFIEQSGRLIPQQVIALNRMATRDRPRQALPEFSFNDVLGQAFQGQPEAQRIMGMVYDPAFVDGPAGLPKDRTQARSSYEKAAAQGDVTAASLLGAMLVAQDNPIPDRDAGMKWLQMAAEHSDTTAALRLAELVVEGKSNSASLNQAMPFLQIAARNPNTAGMANAWLRHIGQPPVVQ